MPPAVERAIFTSSRSGRIEGYQLTAVSDGVSSADRQELSRWSPAHDALADEGMGAESVNFHRLASGTFCISRTVHAGAEYSGRGGLRVYTDLLLPPPELLARFANNPFRLLEAATAAGHVGGGLEPTGDRLEPIQLAAGASNVDCILLARLARYPGPEVTARFVDAVLKHESLAVSGRVSLRKMIAGLFSLLPVELRSAFSFSSGLKPSKQRVFRIQLLEATAPRGAARRKGDPERLWLDEPPAGARAPSLVETGAAVACRGSHRAALPRRFRLPAPASAKAISPRSPSGSPTACRRIKAPLRTARRWPSDKALVGQTFLSVGKHDRGVAAITVAGNSRPASRRCGGSRRSNPSPALTFLRDTSIPASA